MICNLQSLRMKENVVILGDEEIEVYDLILRSDDVGNKSPYTWDARF